MKEILNASLSQATIATYQQAWSSFRIFCINQKRHNVKLPLLSTLVALFATHIYTKGYAASYIATYMSALSFLHKLNELPDPTSTFVIKKMMQGLRKL